MSGYLGTGMKPEKVNVYGGMVNAERIMDAICTAAYFNPPLWELATNFSDSLPDGARVRDSVEKATVNGSTVFEALVKQAPKLANCIHDFVYQITNPLDSLTTRDLAREKVAKTILKL